MAAWRWLGRRQANLLLPVAWVAIVFLHQGMQWVKAMRYLLPIYPALIVLAAWFLIILWDGARIHRRIKGSGYSRSALAAAGGVLGLVVVGSLLWALAFTHIYRHPHSRVAASHWIMDQIPPGSGPGQRTLG